MKIKICARKFKVKVVQTIRMDGKNYQGICDHKEKEIVIAAESCLDPMATFIHELFHGYVNIVGVDWNGILTPEYMADLAGSFGAQILFENGSDVYEKFEELFKARVKEMEL